MAYILIFAFFFISIGTSVFFFLELGHIRTSMTELLQKKDEKAVCLNFTKEAYASLKWDEKDKEFRFQGRMYDVSSVKIESDIVKVFCVFDKKETGLRGTLGNFFSNAPDKNLPPQGLVKVLSQKYFVSPVFSLSGLNNFSFLATKPYTFLVHTFENELTDPPPRD